MFFKSSVDLVQIHIYSFSRTFMRYSGACDEYELQMPILAASS